jgi:hypothetical protein
VTLLASASQGKRLYEYLSSAFGQRCKGRQLFVSLIPSCIRSRSEFFLLSVFRFRPKGEGCVNLFPSCLVSDNRGVRTLFAIYNSSQVNIDCRIWCKWYLSDHRIFWRARILLPSRRTTKIRSAFARLLCLISTSVFPRSLCHLAPGLGHRRKLRQSASCSRSNDTFI